MSESNRQPDGDANDRTFTEEQQPLFESGDTSDKTRRRTPGAQSVPPTEPAAERGDAPPGVSDAG